jgi:cardiolipin synthase (CMP-forming)
VKWEPRYTRRGLTVANLFTAARIVLVPFFAAAWVAREDVRALWLFSIAAATDLVDGFFARWLNQSSRLGALLDPIADKLLVFVALVVGLLRGEVPPWLAAVIITRDGVLATGAVLFATRWRRHHGPVAWQPTRIGKYAMVMQSVTIAALIIDSAIGPAGMRVYVEVAMIWTAVLTVVAGTQYVLRASRALARSPELASGPGPGKEPQPT